MTLSFALNVTPKSVNVHHASFMRNQHTKWFHWVRFQRVVVERWFIERLACTEAVQAEL